MSVFTVGYCGTMTVTLPTRLQKVALKLLDVPASTVLYTVVVKRVQQLWRNVHTAIQGTTVRQDAVLTLFSLVQL